MSDLIVHGLPLLGPIPETSVGIQIYNSLMKCTNEEVAYVDFSTGKELLYKNFFQLTCQLANSLQNCGYKENDVIAICSENSNYFFIPVVAALYLGMVSTTLNNTYTEGELLHSINITKPKIAFCSKNALEHFENLKNRLTYVERIIIMDSEDETKGYDSIEGFIEKYCDVNFSVDNFTPVKLNPFDHLAVMICSSGTTGLPKSVMVTHDNISAILNHIHDPRLYISGGVFLGMLPFFHCYGFMMNVGAIVERNKVVVLKRFNREFFLKSIEMYRINILLMVPPLMHFLAESPLVLKYDLSSVKDIFCGAAPLSKQIEVVIKARLPNVQIIRQAYGLTEATLAVLMIHLNEPKAGSLGKVVPGMSAIVTDPESGNRLGPNQVGELCFKGRTITKGYYCNEEATKSTYSPDGWLYTGDLGYYDGEHYFYIVGRLKELIKYKGFQVAPAELEGILINHPEVKDVAVVGKPDEQAGELPTAFIVREPCSKLTEQEIKEYIAHKVSRTKQLHGGVYFIDEIPKNPSGKILRRQLRELLSKNPSK